MVRCIGVLVLLAACKQIFGLSAPAKGDAGAVDSDIPDASPCMAASTECIGDVLRTCSGPGVFPVDTTCNWGCDTSAPHCYALIPTGGAVTMQDVAADASLASVALDVPMILINGDTGAIGTAADPSSVRSPGPGTKNGIGYRVTSNVAVFTFASLSITATTLPIGAHAVALVAAGEISVSADIDAQAPCRGDGALGGFAGGGSGSDGGGAGGGLGGPNNSTAGCGGGYGGQGGRGGRNATAGAVNGDAMITMLVGGSGGGGGGSPTSGGHGGAGGGALELVSGARITVAAGINAGGCGGTVGSGGGGGGGGAGGALLFEAPDVSIPATIAVNGGGGAASSGGTDGANGALDRVPAPGGTGAVDGGTGAAGATMNGGNGQANGPPASGGGGGIGRIRVNTRSGTATLNGTYSPAPSDPQTTFTVGTAALQ